VIFSVAIGLSLFVGVQWKLNQDLKQIDKRWKSDLDFSYQSARLGITGKVVITGVELYFKKQDINISIDRVSYSTDSVLDLAFLLNHIQSSQLPDQIELSLNEVVIPLTPSLVELINQHQSPSIWTGLLATACGNVRNLGYAQYFAMGYDYLVFSSELEINQDETSGNLLADGWFDIEETAMVKYQMNLANIYNQESTDTNLSASSVESIQLNIDDKGLHLRRNEYCGLKQKVTADEFIQQHVKQLKTRLSSVGIKMLPTGRRAFSEWMKPSSQLTIEAKPRATFSSSDFGFYDEAELRDILNLSITLNSQPVGTLFQDWALDKLEQINLNDFQEEQQNGLAKRFETITIKRSYQPESVGNIDDFIGQSVKIVKTDGREYLGKLVTGDERKIILAMPVEGGVVEISIQKNLMKQLFIYR
jgi:hypothetical protein